MTYELLRILHVLGVIVLFAALGGLTVLAINHRTSATNRGKTLAASSHGVAMLLLLVSGIALLSHLNLSLWDWPVWVWLKLLLWLLFGFVIMVVKRKPHAALLFWILLPLLGGLAGYLAIAKPGA